MGNDRTAEKQAVGNAAAELIEPGMVIGLGTGSTAAFLVKALGERIRKGLTIKGAVPTSQETAHLAASLGIPLTTLDVHPTLDLAIDGADEIDPQLNLIKGAGGALLREKVVASAARRFVVIGDSSKLAPRLGTHFALPVEVILFALTPVRRQLERLGASVEQRTRSDNQAYLTDNGNPILDCRFSDGIADPGELQERIRAIAGVVEHGLFLGIAESALIAGPEGVRKLL